MDCSGILTHHDHNICVLKGRHSKQYCYLLILIGEFPSSSADWLVHQLQILISKNVIKRYT